MHLLKYRSGIEEEYSELQQLLHDIYAYRRDRIELENKQKKRKTGKEKTVKGKMGKGKLFIIAKICRWNNCFFFVCKVSTYLLMFYI